MKARYIVFAIATSGLFASPVFAQFHLSRLLGGTPSAAVAGTGTGTGTGSQDALVTTFVSSQTEVLQAQSLLSQAYGLKDQAKLCDDQVTALKSTSVDKDTLKRTVEVSEATNKLITAQQNSRDKLSASEKQYYVQSLPHLARGIAGTSAVALQAESLGSSFSNPANMLGKVGLGMSTLKSGIFIAKSMPAYSKSLYEVFRKTIAISHSNGVKVPSDATAALGNL